MSNLKFVRQGKGDFEKITFNKCLLDAMKERRISRGEASAITGLGDSNTRYEIRLISLFYPVLTDSSGKGYQIVNTSEVTEEEADYVLEQLDHTINEFKSRIAIMKKRLKPLIASKKVLEKKFGRKEKENE